jgi:hypothetical protein
MPPGRSECFFNVEASPVIAPTREEGNKIKQCPCHRFHGGSGVGISEADTWKRGPVRRAGTPSKPSCGGRPHDLVEIPYIPPHHIEGAQGAPIRSSRPSRARGRPVATMPEEKEGP